MSPTDSAPTRREVVTQASMLAALAAAGSGVVPVLASAAHSTIEAAYAEYVRLAKLSDAASNKAYEISNTYEEPPRPRYHHFRSQGGSYINFTNAECTRGTAYCEVGDDNVERLKAMIAKPFDPSGSELASVEWDRRSHERTIEQAKETLARVEAWRADRDRRRAAIGLDQAEEIELAAEGAAQAQIDVVLEMRATTLREFALQALVAYDKHHGENDQVPIYSVVDCLTAFVGVKPHYDLQQDAA